MTALLELGALTERVIGSAIEVHRRLGPGFVEAIYENALCIEMPKHGIALERQVRVPVWYEQVRVGIHRLDRLVEGQLIVELKAVQAIEDAHLMIARSYARALGKRHALVLNFGRPRLEIRRAICPADP